MWGVPESVIVRTLAWWLMYALVAYRLARGW